MARGFILPLVLCSALINAGAFGQARPGKLSIDEALGSSEGWSVGYNAANLGCVASTKFSDETTVWLGVSVKNNDFFLALTNPNWRSIEAGKQYALRLSLLGAGRWQGTFVGIDQDSEKGVISGNLKSDFVSGVVRSPGVAVSLGSRTIAQLSLQGSPAAFDAIVQCQKERSSGFAKRQQPPDEGPARKGSSSGTGFFITGDGHILTNQHVIGDCGKVRVQRPGGVVHGARVLASDAQNDLGLIVTDLKPPAVAPMRSDVKLGENVSVFGFPLSDMLASSGNFTVGYVSALAGLRDDSSNIQISAQVQPGNSGGPVLDRSGNVVAVVVAMLNSMAMIESKNLVPQNVNFAIKSRTALSFLDANGVKPTAAAKSAVLETADVAEQARAFTVKILCDAR